LEYNVRFMKNLAFSLLVAAFLSPPCASAQTEMGVEHDFSVYGVGGTAADPNVEIKGFTVFGSTQAAYGGGVIGPGNVVVNGVLAVSSGAYFVGNSTFTGAGNIFINDGSAGQLLRRHALGYLEWTDLSSSGDNLGDHIATTTLQMGAYGINSSSAVSAAYYEINGSTMVAVLPGTNSIAYGVNAGTSNAASGNNNMFIGNSAGASNTTGVENTFMGHQAGYSNTGTGVDEGYQNVFVGHSAGYNSTGLGNVFVGYKAGYMNTSATRNTFIGESAGYNTISPWNTFVGHWTAHDNTTGSLNTIMGRQAGQRNTTGNKNTIIGADAALYTLTGSANAILGYRAGFGATGGSFSSSTLVGYQAGYKLRADGNSNIFLGWQAGYNVTTGTGNIVIGYNIDPSGATANNEVNIGNVYKGNVSSGTAQIPKVAVQEANTGITLTSADFGKTITVNSASNQTVALPAVTAADIGATITVVKLGAGNVIVDAPAGVYIADSSSGGTIINNLASQTYATITLRLVTSTRWVILWGDGCWTTT
jgi:hypothetical protein